jgi:hypothetical protein
MSRIYVTKSVDVDVEIDLSEFDDQDIIDEYSDRGLNEQEKEFNAFERDMEHVKWEWYHGSKTEALKILESLLKLDGLSKAVI